MKNRASVFLKEIISVLKAVIKSKSMALKSKTRDIKTRLIIFSLLRNKKDIMGSISDKIHSLLQQQRSPPTYNAAEGSKGKAIVVYETTTPSETIPDNHSCTYEVVNQEYYELEDDKYPDLTHTLFDDETQSVIDLVKNSKEGVGKEFILEDEIDNVADLFIRRFHHQMRLQKQESFKRYQEMLQRSV
ncbi:hypothetical protein GIB67_038324 [Kingdonia uniflora]|uniref:DUF761 domain-containing protein n=1 Tax=Kingdonia uniflora TaxID=39325 RepID=A0A7J7KUJ8_9MAGN|nr:hypothetical protein GIB67_038324 [Kingdonia uniflora]